jgi:acyl carrier protein
MEAFAMREITPEIREEIKDMIFDYYAEECEVDKDEITMETNPQNDLGSDSLMFVELIEMTADKYDMDIKLQAIGKYMLKSPMDTMKDVVDMFCKIYQYGNDIVDQ